MHRSTHTLSQCERLAAVSSRLPCRRIFSLGKLHATHRREYMYLHSENVIRTNNYWISTVLAKHWIQ